MSKNDSDIACAGIDVTINMLWRAKEMIEDGNFIGARFVLDGVGRPSLSQAIEVISRGCEGGEK